MADPLSPLSEPSDSDHSASATELPPFKRVGSNESRISYLSSSPSPADRESKSFWDSESLVNLTSADEEKWMISQKATFTNWVNERLKSDGKIKVTDLVDDLQDGTVLIRLVEILTGKKIKGFNKPVGPSLAAHKLANLELAFKLMKSSGVKLVGIGSHNIHDGDTKRVLGLIWTLIQKYQLRMEGTQVSTKAVMIDWLRALLPSWNISDLTTDWNDGRALVALINEVKPGIAPDVRRLDLTKHQANCNLAINIAFNHLKIPKLISAESLCRSTIDELSIITYLSYFRDPARARLLKMVRKMLPQFNISNFLTDWTDGRAYVALTNKCFPGILSQYTSLEKEKALENIQLVLKTIKHKLGITPNFTAKKMSSGDVEELQVMTLVMRIRDGKLQPLPDEIVVSGPGIREAEVGKVTYFTIDTAKAGPGNLTVDITYMMKSGKKVDCSIEREDRIVTVSYSPIYAGKLNIDIRWSGVHVPNSPFQLRVSDSLMVKIVDFDHHKRVVQANERIELKVNTIRAGQGELTAHLQYGSEEPIPAEVITVPNSVTKLQYTPPKCGQAVLHVFWNGEKLNHLTITYTVLDITNYQVVSKPASRLYRVLEHIRFSVQTKGGGNLQALQMTAMLNGDEAQVPLRFDVVDGYTGHVVFRPTLAGAYVVEIACIDQLIHGSPFIVDVIDPSQCKLLETTPEYLQLNHPYTFEIEMKGAGRGALTFECEDSQAATPFEVKASPPDHLDISKVEVIPQKEGHHLIKFKFQGTEIPGCPFRIFVCDPSRCQVSGEVLQSRSAMVGKAIRFQVMVDPIEDLKPSIKATGPTAKYTPSIRETSKNVYTVQFTPWEVGTHDISVTYGDFHIPNSPFLVSVATFDSTTCSATGSGLQQAYTGIPAQFIVLAKQEGLLKDGTLQVKVKGVMSDTECMVRGRDNQNGSYNIAYLVPSPGAYLISIIANDQPIPGSPFRLTALPGPTANKCHMYGPILQPDAVLTIGYPMDFSVDASAAGNGSLTVKAIGPGGAQARVYLAKNKKGIYSIKLDPVKPGKYRVSVKWSEDHIPGSPFMLKIYPGADASKCKAHGSGLEDGLVGEARSFVIETRDAGAGKLQVRFHGVRNAFKVDIKPVDGDVRTLIANYNPKKPGDYLVTIKWSEKHVPGSPFRLKITGEDIETDSPMLPMRATPRNEALNPIAEDGDEGNWGDEEEGGGMGNSVPVQPESSKRKKKKKNKKSSTKGEVATTSATPTAQGQSNPANAMPMFNPTAMRVAFKDTVETRSESNQKRKVKGRKASKSAMKKSASASALPQNRLITFSGLQPDRMRKKSLPMTSTPNYYSARDYGRPSSRPGIIGLPH